LNTSIPVLVVDSTTVSTIIFNHLRKLGFTDVDFAQNGKAALDHLNQKPYGLILSDWEMQPMGGDQFLKELQQKPGQQQQQPGQQCGQQKPGQGGQQGGGQR
jgi:two-component system chemotaxis response regulator CheY